MNEYEQENTGFEEIKRKIIEDYGVWGEKTTFGRTYMGTFRTTFVIDKKGIITHVIRKVESGKASQQVLDLLQ